MPLRTTVIGSYPKPEYLPTSDWFRDPDFTQTLESTNKLRGVIPEELDELYKRAEKQVIKEQSDIGIDIITDGELRRENYFCHLCRHLKGFDFDNYKTKVMRNGACKTPTSVIVEKIESSEPFAGKEWQAAQALSDRPLKYTLPGPMTILNSVNNSFYSNEKEASQDLVKVINKEILDLVQRGCKHIQLDEPLFVRKSPVALEYGIEHAEQCFEGVGDEVLKTVHICCGYPIYLDQKDYAKADPGCYEIIAQRLDKSIFDCISIEDAVRYNSASLFEKFKNKTLVIGVVQIACSEVESVEQIRSRVHEILKSVPPQRCILSPDCGLGFLADDKIRLQKLRNMVHVANEI